MVSLAVKNNFSVGYERGDLLFLNNFSLEWGFFSKYSVNRRILPFLVLSVGQKSSSAWKNFAVRG